MIKLWLIRHGMTEGNRYGRYIGVTDEPLCPEGRLMLERVSYPAPEMVFSSPLLRCRETAGILFPEKELQIIPDLAECDFGDFENKNYKELSGNEDYQAWIDSNGTLPFPGGESREEFRERSLRGFDLAAAKCIEEKKNCAALVIHGGTIMNIMAEYGIPARSFYDWHVKNGGGYLVEFEETEWQNGRCTLHLCEAVMEG